VISTESLELKRSAAAENLYWSSKTTKVAVFRFTIGLKYEDPALFRMFSVSHSIREDAH
jgi:hypothetical protein